MSEFKKISKLSISAAYTDASFLKQDYLTVAKARLEAIDGAPQFRELNLRIVVDNKDAEELLEGLTAGKAYISIENIPTLLER